MAGGLYHALTHTSNDSNEPNLNSLTTITPAKTRLIEAVTPKGDLTYNMTLSIFGEAQCQAIPLVVILRLRALAKAMVLP